MKTIKDVLETPGACIVDVRNPYEFEEEHIAGALNIPLDQVMGSIDKFKSFQSRWWFIAEVGVEVEWQR